MIIIETIIGVFVTFVLGVLIKSDKTDTNFITVLKKVTFAIVFIFIYQITIVNMYFIVIDTDMFWNNIGIKSMPSIITILSISFLTGLIFLSSYIFITLNYTSYKNNTNNIKIISPTNIFILILLMVEWVISVAYIYVMDSYIWYGAELDIKLLIKQFFIDNKLMGIIQIVIFVGFVVTLTIIAVNILKKFSIKSLDKHEDDENKKIYQEIEDYDLFNSYKDLTNSKSLKEFKSSHYYPHIKKYEKNKK
ncbi:hypothetical protein [Methanobrevibacter sp. UBA46]|jgi:hypothetical protein|uniref:hypothetical protein n=1 Tax=Methanobrevibacter sp. UBA46 TaxID=1915488 RepID=UPI0039B911C7